MTTLTTPIAPATIRDVAKASGVSIATVSYVINDGPRRVEPATRTKVMAAMELLQYHPSTMARGLNRKRLDCLGVVFPMAIPSLVSDSYFSAILDGITHVATEHEQNVVLYTGLKWRGRASLPAFRDRRVDGLLLIAPLTDSGIVSTLTEAGLPFVLINGTDIDTRVASVDIDNVEAARQVVSYLQSLGHRRISLLGGLPNSPSTLPRRQGYEAAMSKSGFHCDQELIREGSYTQGWGYDGMCQLLALTDPPTAVFAGGDGIALGAYRACADSGISVPDRMSIVGFDDAEFAHHLSPPLTTVRQPLMQIGSTAALMLLDRLTHGQAEEIPATQTVLPSELIIRASTMPPHSLTA
ncbi:MAG: LacI family DNA-binding transcriptional regulator [Janthinobacterium lividum]